MYGKDYVSGTIVSEKIMSKFCQVKTTRRLHVGAKFYQSISAVHELSC